MHAKDLREIIEGLVAQGCEVTRTTRGWLIKLPDGSTTTFHGTLSDYRAQLNMRALIKRAGLVWPLDDRAAIKRIKRERRFEED